MLPPLGLFYFMFYNFDIEYKQPAHKLMKGIYKITIGNKFYIGQSKRLAVRMYQHQRGITGCLNRYGMPRPYEMMYLPWARYLNENPYIKSGQVEVIQRCISALDLYYAESFFLNELANHPDCLNASFAPSRYLNDDMWDIEVKDGWVIYYFDRNDPAKKYEMYQRLKVNGEIWTKKPSKKELHDIQQLLSPHPAVDTTL
jgi:hypothetical protein